MNVTDLFDSNKVSPAIQRTRVSDSKNMPLYFDGGYAKSLPELQELNEAELIGRQVGGRRTRNRRAKGRRTRNRKNKVKGRLSTYRR